MLGGDVAVAVSDSSVAASLRLWLDRCPSENDLAAAIVRCDAAEDSPRTLYAAVGQSAAAVSASSPATLDEICDTATVSPVRLAQAAWVGAFFSQDAGAADRGGTLRCSVSDAGTGQVLASGSLAIVSSPTTWPLWDDAISVSAAGAMRSARLGLVVNATSALLAAAATLNPGSPTALASALACPLAVLLAAQGVWAHTSLPPASSISQAFTLTLVGASRVVFRAAASGAFSANQTNASLSGARCNISAVSADGAWAVLDTPSSMSLCRSDSRECGYARLVVVTAASPLRRGASLACPPFCPGVVGSGVVPVASSEGDFVLGLEPSSPVGALPVALPAARTTSAGIFYAVECADTGLWTDPTSGACSNASDPASYGCAYGGGSACSVCPVGAVCPGGARLWPRAGFWSPSEGSPAVLACARPLPALRCLGWNALTASTQCGPGYLQGSYLCGACARGFYTDDAGSCTPCPVISSVWHVSLDALQ